KLDDLRQAAIMFVEQYDIILRGQRAVHHVEQAVRAIVPLRALAGRETMLRRQSRLPILTQERKMAQLLGIAADNRASRTIEQWQRAADITLRRLIHDHQ